MYKTKRFCSQLRKLEAQKWATSFVWPLPRIPLAEPHHSKILSKKERSRDETEAR